MEENKNIKDDKVGEFKNDVEENNEKQQEIEEVTTSLPRMSNEEKENEYEEITMTSNEENLETLESMTEKELQEVIGRNNRIIEDNNKTLKKALVERILNQQKIISEQQQEIMKLNSQKKEL